MPTAWAAAASSAASAIDIRSTPGIASTGVRDSVPSSTKSGWTRCAGDRSVSRTIARSTPVFRSRRIRVAGNGMRSVYARRSSRP
jgi:hypothetical protein